MENNISIKEFNLFRDLIYKKVGISLTDKKIGLVQSRLSKRLKALQINTFLEYYHYVEDNKNKEELFHLINAISTNVTSFFREESQWRFLRKNLHSILQQKGEKKLRIWSAACSSGEEPYSITMFLHNSLKDFHEFDIKILATDISKEVLTKASKGEYKKQDLKGLPLSVQQKYFTNNSTLNQETYHIKPELKSLITFRMFNLVHGDFSIFKNKFDLIFCRNVMIYFDKQTQKKLILDFAQILEKNGLLFIGHSESIDKTTKEFKTLQPSIYKRT